MNKENPTPDFTSQTSSKEGTYLDGRKQVIDLLKILPPDEKKTLLKNIKLRNPEIARELMEEGVSFSQLETLSDEKLKILFDYVSSQLLGLALKRSSQQLAKRLLSLMPRSYAENAFYIMKNHISDENKRSLIAQEKIINTAVKLYGPHLFQVI